ncbi:leucine zipper domain-containing protein [Janibacter cremeus]|uniref:leucine zipper domain-containing protein n=1 Tax=Janibacter cremeus TaxID=1285192 RepID=UPI003CCD2C5A
MRCSHAIPFRVLGVAAHEVGDTAVSLMAGRSLRRQDEGVKPFITSSQPEEPALCPTIMPRCRSRVVVSCADASTVHEASVTRQCLSEWVARWRGHGDEGLHDRGSRPRRSPTATPQVVVVKHPGMSRDCLKRSAPRAVLLSHEKSRPPPAPPLGRRRSTHRGGGGSTIDASTARSDSSHRSSSKSSTTGTTP